jgi:hypothetical protein
LTIPVGGRQRPERREHDEGSHQGAGDCRVDLGAGGVTKLGSATTSASGHWKITASGSAGISLGHFYAKVAKRSKGAAATIYVCTAAKSKTIALHQ